MMDRAPIDSALILTTTRIFNRPGEPSPASPRTMVGGLSLFQRTILTLQRGGISRFIVLAGNETEDLRRQLRSDERMRGEVRWLPVLEFSPGDPRTWEIFPGLFGAPYLVVGTGAVFPASLVARVRQEAGNGAPLVVVRGMVGHEGVRNRVGAGREPALQAGEGMSQAAAGVVTVEEAATQTLDVDLVVIPEGFTASGWATPQARPFPLHAAR